MAIYRSCPSMPKFRVVAKDFHSPLVRNEIWVQGIRQWPQYFQIPTANIGIVSKGNAISYVIDPESFQRAKEVFLDRVEHDPLELARVMEQSELWGKELNAATEQLAKADLSSWSSLDLAREYEQFVTLQARQYAVGTLLPLIDLVGGSYVELWLKEYLAKRLHPAKQLEAFAIFTTPTRKSFSLDQEEALMELANELFCDPMICDLFNSREASEVMRVLQANFPDAWNKLEQHTKRYAWVYYVYEGPAYTEAQFVEFLRQIVRQPHSPREQLERMHADRRKLIAQRDALLAELNPSERERALLLLVAEFVWSKPRRKDYQSKSYFHMETFFRELARRTGVSLRHVRAATQTQIVEGLEKGTMDPKVLQEQYRFHAVIPEGDRVRILVGTAAEAFVSTLEDETVETAYADEIKGSTAFPGKARGNVCVVNSSEDIPKMRNGDILVSIATSPSIVVAMKKAAAIITDEGGLTCHAAIVSRELRIPCVVGTKIATSALKDGDEIEVNADTGNICRVRNS